MPLESPSRETTFGYLSTIQSPEYGYFGGYLILSTFGRPLEFHCTSPVRPSRAQEILYGPALQPYLLGEQIGGALLAAAKLTPRLILVDQPAMTCLRPQAGVPIAVVLAPTHRREAAGTQKETCEVDIASSTGPLSSTSLSGDVCTVGACDIQLPASSEAEQQTVVDLLTQLGQHVELAEPFGRIHEAIREAQRIGGRTAEAHGQAA